MTQKKIGSGWRDINRYLKVVRVLLKIFTSR